MKTNNRTIVTAKQIFAFYEKKKSKKKRNTPHKKEKYLT